MEVKHFLSWTIKISSKAEKYYKRLSGNLKKRINKNLTALSKLENPIEHDEVKPLTGELRGFYRLRVGDYRIVFGIIKEEHIIAVVNMAPRGDVYK